MRNLTRVVANISQWNQYVFPSPWSSARVEGFEVAEASAMKILCAGARAVSTYRSRPPYSAPTRIVVRSCIEGVDENQ